MTATKIEIDPNEVYESIKTRVIGLGLDDYYKFRQDYNIEALTADLEPCILESKGNRFVVCREPYSNRGSIKIPEKIALDLKGDPYFDNKVDRLSGVGRGALCGEYEGYSRYNLR